MHVSEARLGRVGRIHTLVSYSHANSEERLYVVVPPLLSAAIHEATRELFDAAQTPASANPVKWTAPSQQAGSPAGDFPSIIELPPGSGQVKQITFHRKGDYFATVCTRAGYSRLLLLTAHKNLY